LAPQGTEPQDSNLAWWIGQALGYKNVQEDIAVMHDPCACPLRKGIAGIGAVANAVMGISTVHGVGVAAKSAPQMARAFSSSDPIQTLQTFARSRGATYHPTSYVDDAGRIYPNYRPRAGIMGAWDRLRRIGGTAHEYAHYQQEFRTTGLLAKELTFYQRVSKATTDIHPLMAFTPPYSLNPAEVHAFASGAVYAENLAHLAISRWWAYQFTYTLPEIYFEKDN
jgi:hypothetical protein